MSNTKKAPALRTVTVAEIPENELPYFDPVRGTEGAELKAFVKKYKLNPEQVRELIKKLEDKK